MTVAGQRMRTAEDTSLFLNSNAPHHACERQSKTPATAVSLFLYVVAVILFSFQPGYSVIATVIGITLAIVFFVEILFNRQNIYFGIPLNIYLLFLVYCTLQMVWSPGNITAVLTLLQLFILTFIVINQTVNGNGIAYVEFAVYTGILVSFIYVLVFKDYGTDGRIGSTIGNQNEYSYVLMAGVVLMARRILINSIGGLQKFSILVLCCAYIVLSLYGIFYLAGSRAGTAVTLASLTLLAFYWAYYQSGRRRILALAGVCLVIVFLGVAVSLSPQSARFMPLEAYVRGEAVQDTSLLVRDRMLRDGVALWLQRPFTGWGVDSYRSVSGWGTYAHNNYVELLVNGGVIGLLLYLMVPISAVAYLVRGWYNARDALAKADAFWGVTLLLALAAWDLTIVSYYSKLFWLMMGLVIGIAGRVRRSEGKWSP